MKATITARGLLTDIATRRTNAHVTDPASSHEAIAVMVESGAHESHMATILAALKRHPGLTASQLSRETGIEVHEVRRRLTNLKDRREAVQGEAIRQTPGGRGRCSSEIELGNADDPQWSCTH